MLLCRGMHIRANTRVGILCAVGPPLLLNQNLSKRQDQVCSVLALPWPCANKTRGCRSESSSMSVDRGAGGGGNRQQWLPSFWCLRCTGCVRKAASPCEFED